MPNLSPRQHPNAYAAGTAGGAVTFLVTEAKLRLGVDLTVDEAGWIVVSAIFLFHLCSRFLGGKKGENK